MIFNTWRLRLLWWKDFRSETHTVSSYDGTKLQAGLAIHKNNWYSNIGTAEPKEVEEGKTDLQEKELPLEKAKA